MDAAIFINDAFSWIVSHPGRADMMPAPLNMLRPTAFRLRLWVERIDDALSSEFADDHRAFLAAGLPLNGPRIPQA